MIADLISNTEKQQKEISALKIEKKQMQQSYMTLHTFCETQRNQISDLMAAHGGGGCGGTYVCVCVCVCVYVCVCVCVCVCYLYVYIWVCVSIII